MWKTLVVLGIFNTFIYFQNADAFTYSPQCLSSRTITGPLSKGFIKSLSCTHINMKRIGNLSKNNLQMHGGHSHSHHHHHHHNHDRKEETKPFQWKQVRLSRRAVSRILFSALATLVPPLLFRHQRPLRYRIANVDVAAFLITSTTLNLSQKLKHQIQNMITNAKRLRDGVVKHTAPKGGQNVGRRGAPTKFFFSNNAADRVTYLGVLVNLILSIGKAIVGVTCHSAALVADAGHSLSDLFSDFITLWAVQIGRLPPDDDHPYGHGKFESIGSLFLSFTLLATGISVGAVSNKRLMEILSIQFSAGKAISSSYLIPEIPTFPCLIMALISIISKEWLYRITRNVGERLNSQVVIANAWHHRSDAYSSILALISIAMAMVFPTFIAADSAAGLLVAGMICMTGFEIMTESIKQLTDTNNEELVERIHKLIEKEEIGETGDVIEIERVRARQVGSLALVDVVVSTANGLSSSASRSIEDRIKWRIMEEEGKGGAQEGGAVFDAEVHATSAGTINCPLLVATGMHSMEEEGNKNTLSAAGIEEDARNVLESHPEVQSVQGITVHYHDTLLIDVDAQIRIDSSQTDSVQSAYLLAKDLRYRLERNGNIDKAKIFLDLNADTSILTKMESDETHDVQQKNNTIISSTLE